MQTVTIDREELDRRIAAANEKDQWLNKLYESVAKETPRRQARIDAQKALIVEFQAERARELAEAHKHRNLARLAKGKIMKAVRRIHQAQKITRNEKGLHKKISKRKRGLKKLVVARLAIETAKQLRRTLKL